QAGLLSNPVTAAPAALPAALDTATAIANALVETYGYLERSVRQLGHRSRINTVSRGFSELDGAAIGLYADGIAAQTRGFVDLNGDGLPDYVVTNDAESPCGAGSWQVFWGTGTSSVSQGRAFLPTPTCVSVPAPPPDATDAAGFNFVTLPLSVD